MKAKVKIIGTAPLLMHRYPMEEQTSVKAAKKDKIYDPKTDAESALYKDENGCYVPAVMVEAAMKKAATDFKRGKSSYKDTVVSCVLIEDDKIRLNKDTYDEIDRRPVVVQRNRVVRSRPMFKNWELSFTINFNEDRISSDIIKQILEEAGSSKGIGDYRPRFGRFKVEIFETI